jgi:uncharacterized protein YjbI with pentapeptide repeats
MSTIVVRRPRDIWRAPLQVDFAEILAGLAKGGAATYLGSPGSAAGSVIDALRKTKVKLKRDPGELAWMLVVRALILAIREAADAPPLRGRVAPEELDAFVDAVAIFVGEHQWPLEKTFFSRPSQLPAVHDIAASFATWLTESGTDRMAVKAAQRNVVDFFAGAIDAAWREGEATWEPIRKALDMPFVEAKRNDEVWRGYHDSLIRLRNEPLFDETFSLAEIYVPPRCAAYFEGAQTPEILDAAEELDRWIRQTKDRDALRVISGEPGSGKSSFVTMYAGMTAVRGNVDVLFIPLYLFELGEYLEESVARFAASTAALPDPFETGARRLLLIFDGVDELVMQGRHGSEVARDFVERLAQLLRRRNTKGVRVLAVVTGREILIQSIGGAVDRSRLMTLQPFYLPSPERFLGDPEIAKIDQRHEWWRRYGALKGKPYGGLPPQLAREELNELTSQPLLNYLVALSFERGRIDFEAGPNLNLIYADLLDAVYERGWAKVPHPVTTQVHKNDFARVLQEIAVTTWQGNGRTATVAEVAAHCGRRGFDLVLRRFAADCEAGLGRFLTVFYFRYRDERLKGERTFEFTHKSFGEYLTAKWIVAEALTFVPEQPELLRWLVAFGPMNLDAYLVRFFENEVALLPEADRDRIAASAQDVLYAAVSYELPVERLEPRPDYPDETVVIENAGIMALAFLSAAGRAEGVPRFLDRLDSGDDLGHWLRRVVGPTLSQFRPALHCLSHLKIINADFRNLDLWSADLSHSELREARFDHAMIENASFDGCALEKATFDGAVARGASFDEKANLTGARMQDANFTEAEMPGAILDGMWCLDTSFRDARLQRASLRGAELLGCTLDRCSLEGADLTEAIVTGWVTGASFAGVVFIGADLGRATFADCNFEGAAFGGTKAAETTFRLCDLTPEQRDGLTFVNPADDEGG